MSRSKAGVLVPPRPNLGPEPWAETRPSGVVLPALWIVLVLVIAVIGAGWRLRRLRKRRRPASGISGSTPGPAGAPVSRRDHRIALSGAVREVLVARFGPAWRSKTTEEIAHDAGLAEAFGPEDAARLVRFLHGADLAKFADEGGLSTTPPPDHGEDWVEAFLAESGGGTKGSRAERGRPPTSSPAH